jgi:hypothetical protein
MLPCNSLNDEQLRQGHEQALFKVSWLMNWKPVQRLLK